MSHAGGHLRVVMILLNISQTFNKSRLTRAITIHQFINLINLQLPVVTDIRQLIYNKTSFGFRN